MFLQNPQDTTKQDVKNWLSDRKFFEEGLKDDGNSEYIEELNLALSSDEELSKWIKAKAEKVENDRGGDFYKGNIASKALFKLAEQIFPSVKVDAN